MAPFLKHSIVQMDNPALILANIESNIPRSVLDGVIKTQCEVLQVCMKQLLKISKLTMSLGGPENIMSCMMLSGLPRLVGALRSSFFLSNKNSKILGKTF